MPSEEDAAATKLQAIKRGKDARHEVEQGKAARKVQSMQRGKKSRRGGDKLLQMVQRSDLARFEALLADGNEPTPEVLQAALSSPLRAFATKLVSVESCWTVDHKLLKVWKKVQTALYPPKPEGEDEEEPEPVDVADEEWQAGVAAEVYGEDNPDGKFFVQQVVKLGCYTGERSAADEQVEPSFDGELMPREGYGLALMPKGAVYAGNFAAGAREGVGVYKYTDGTCYCGDWLANQKHGEGRMMYKDGSLYEGCWRYNKRHGHGVYTYANGDTYVGAWFTGAKHGKGKYRSASTGSRFTGEWKSGQLVASSVQSSDGSQFFSGFDKGVPSGPGAFAFANGSLALGTHVPAPAGEEGEEEEGGAPKPSTWEGSALANADHMSGAMLHEQFGSSGKKPLTKALIVGVAHGGGAYPEMDLGPAAEALRATLTGPLKMAPEDVTLLEAADAEGNGQHTKEKVTEAIGELVAKLGRGDAAFVGLICHGKKMLDMDNDEIDPKEEGLCLSDDFLSSDDLAELIAKFADASAHLFLYLDSCFDGACLQQTVLRPAEEGSDAPPPLPTPPANFAALTCTLDMASYQKPPPPAEEGGEAPPPSWQAYYANNMTEWLAAALSEGSGAETGTYAELLEAVKGCQAQSDSRTANKQLPKARACG